MSGKQHTLAAFHLLGERPAMEQQDAGHSRLRPALFSGFQDLTKLRYDFPLVLTENDRGSECVQSLADITDGILAEISEPGAGGEQVRLQILKLEQTIREFVAAGHHGSFSETWKAAENRLLAAASEADQPALQANLQLARDTLPIDGDVIDCDAYLPARLVSRLWRASQAEKRQLLQQRIKRLIQKLSDILHVDYMHTAQARSADELRGSVGNADQDVFDFGAMANLLKTAPVGDLLPASRQKRINAAIRELETQRFVVAGRDSGKKGEFRYEFNSCGKARTAYRKRLNDMASLVKAISVAELEIENHYVEEQHDNYFAQFDESSLGPDELAMFPSYLVCISDRNASTKTKTDIIETISSGLPFKIMAQSNNILDDPSVPAQQLSLGVEGQQLAGMALGLNSIFIVQAASSALYRLREPLFRGLSEEHPALISVYSGPVSNPYLFAAAATESRAFPSFVYDPDGKDGMASRFSLEGNPQPNRDWPVHALHFEDSDHNRMSDECAFTLIDFLACDEHMAGHFITVPRSDWQEEMVPVDTFLNLDEESKLGKIPYTLLLTGENTLQRAVVDKRLIEAAQRCHESWRDLQEHGGINNSYAAASLSAAEAAFQEEKEQLIQKAAGSPSPASTPVADTQAVAGAQAVADEPEVVEPVATASDEAWIETPRCTTCNECTELNNRMFAYNDDMQAYIQDLDAGTFREMVEAAETCQVAIIHPGKPRDPGEPDLEALIARATPFI